MTTIPMPEPADGALVLRSDDGRPDVVLERNDAAAKEWPGAGSDERWFPVGDYDTSDPLRWDVVTEAAAREGATLAELVVKTGARAPLPAAEQPIGAVVATEAAAFIKDGWSRVHDGSDGSWSSANHGVTDSFIDNLFADGEGELLRGEVAR